ncbi:hypothetical protein GCM10022206_65400 [Streptomyces chiangmaiensis]
MGSFFGLLAPEPGFSRGTRAVLLVTVHVFEVALRERERARHAGRGPQGAERIKNLRQAKAARQG